MSFSPYNSLPEVAVCQITGSGYTLRFCQSRLGISVAHSADIGRYENPILGKSLSILGFSASIISSRPYQRKQLIFPFQARIDDEKDYIE